MNRIICLTGGIGSGKTTVSNFFKEAGIPVYIADERAKQVMERPDIIAVISRLFEPTVVLDNQSLNRQKIREIVFKDAEKLSKLNAIVHPAVAADFKIWLQQQKEAPFVIKESAILFESGTQGSCDEIILVTAPEEIRIQRVMLRDGVSQENVQNIMINQMKDHEKQKYCHYIIENTDKNRTKLEVEKIINNILTKNK
ncbi:dephospho-CoA kinase [Flavobacterium sp. NKUCC04_CG]|uniref:dephospho-CoA kinase n=1 Tax=Flavobacterium sp. NKUCC04_CG TaxID=2842121 RepID=UPI001C5B8CE7|nr:dephospho-CoA kinase [Flavobacterium sp. NKUCC04_CG]MBW3519079.1 dephospho-CoA kinase [Flavobacterium sp. NKUCC04_CG]